MPGAPPWIAPLPGAFTGRSALQTRRQELPAHMTGADRRARASVKRLAERSHDAETETAAAVIEDLLYPLRTRGGQIN